MKPFRYPLQSVLVLRQRQEAQALEAYAKRLAAQQEAQARLHALNEQAHALLLHRRRLLASPVTAGELEQMRSYGGRLEDAQRTCNGAVLGAERAVTLALRNMLAVRQKREAMDQHQLQLRKRHDHTLSLEETKLLDDMAARSFQSRSHSITEASV